MTKIQVEFFGKLSDQLGKKVFCDFPDEGETIAQLRMRLANEHACDDLLDMSVRAVINDEMVLENAVVKLGDTIAFMSPLSGG